MKIEKAKEAHIILKKIEYKKSQIIKLSSEDCVLCFGTLSSDSFNRKIYADENDNYEYKSILDKHHKMIVEELKASIVELEKQIEDL